MQVTSIAPIPEFRQLLKNLIVVLLRTNRYFYWLVHGRSTGWCCVRCEPTPKLVRYLACAGHAAVLLMPIQAPAQQPKFEIKADVRVREDSFACKETSDLDRLLQINQRGGFTSGTQLYVYLQRHSCLGLTEGRARVYAIKGQYVCIYDPKNTKKAIKPCAWTRREMLLK